MDLRPRLRSLMAQRGLSLRQLAERSGVRRQSIMRFLKGGNLHLKNLEKILSCLGCRLTVGPNLPSCPEETKAFLKQRIGVDPKEMTDFCQRHGIRSLRVFGSILRPDFKRESDVDLLIELDRPVTYFELAQMERELKKLLRTQHSLDMVTLNSLSPFLTDEVLNQGEVLYEKAA